MLEEFGRWGITKNKMELILEYFSWYEEGRRSGINLRDRVSGSVSDEEEATAVEIRVFSYISYLSQ